MDHRMVMMGAHKGTYWIFTLLRGIASLIIPIILIYLIYTLLIKKNKNTSKMLEKPIDRLKMRLANGEISKEEFEELKKLID